MAKKVLVTAGLPYSNGRLHVGHVAGCYLPADIYVRFLRLKGVDARYICGSDDHGVAIMLAAQKEGKTPQELVNFYREKQMTDFKGLAIEFDAYGSTSQTKFHKELSQQFFLKIYEKGYFTKETTQQFYDEKKQQFLPDRYVTGDCGYCGATDQNGDQCENCGKLLDAQTLKNPRSVSGNKVSLKDTVNWFLDLSKFQSEVEKWLEVADLRDQTRSYVKSLVNSGLVKRSMTRDIDWGIPVPLDDPEAKGKVLYVWFDAPIGYISNTKEMFDQQGNAEEYKNWWSSKDCDVIHYIGEDNTIFHCLIWIAMLSAEGSYSLPKGVVVNQFLNMQMGQDVAKISKSKGIGVWIGDYLEQGGDPDYLRYYLTTIAPEKARTIYNEEEFVSKVNTELANVLGNFINRTLSFHIKYVGDELTSLDSSKIQDIDRAFEQKMKETFTQVTKDFEEYSTKKASHTLMDFCRDCNKYLDDKKPWVTRKEDMELTKVSLYYGIQAISFLSVVLSPIMPHKAAKMAEIFGRDNQNATWESALTTLMPGQKLNKPEILFQRIEEE